jgi:hypothetical protein
MQRLVSAYSNKITLKGATGNWSQYELGGHVFTNADDVPCSAYGCTRDCAGKYYPGNLGENVKDYIPTQDCINACPGVVPIDTSAATANDTSSGPTADSVASATASFATSTGTSGPSSSTASAAGYVSGSSSSGSQTGSATGSAAPAGPTGAASMLHASFSCVLVLGIIAVLTICPGLTSWLTEMQ